MFPADFIKRQVRIGRLLGVFCAASLGWHLELAWAGPTYVYKQANGTVRFSDKPPPDGTQAKVFSARRSTFSWYRVAPLRGGGRLFLDRYNREIAENVALHDVDPFLVKALIHCESGYNPLAVSPKGAQGLMQLMPERARMLGVRNAFDPAQNIEGGVQHLAFLLDKFRGNIKFALAAYNAGEGAVEKYGGMPPYDETQKYVQCILKMRDRYSVAARAKRGAAVKKSESQRASAQTRILNE